VRVEASDGHGWGPAASHGRLVDDQGWALQVTANGARPDGYGYLVRWWDPPFCRGRSYRFVLLANRAQLHVASAPFS
jgi:hypothetical protein